MTTAGRCLCGAVRYEFEAAPLSVIHCHCTMCRKHSGAAFLTYALFNTCDVRFTGEPQVVYRSTPKARRMHCGTCGSPVSFIYDAEPDKIYLTVGTMDQPEQFPPDEHWHFDSKIEWLKFDDNLPHK